MQKLKFGELGKYINSEMYHTLCEGGRFELLTQEHIDEINEHMAKWKNSGYTDGRLPWEYGEFTTKKSKIEFWNFSIYNAAWFNPEYDNTATMLKIPFYMEDGYNKLVYTLVYCTETKEFNIYDNNNHKIILNCETNEITQKNFVIPEDAVREFQDRINEHYK